MSLTKSQTEIISSVFKGNKFIIPSYQRKYSWRHIERKALWDDIVESKEDRMKHFIGTLCFEEVVSEGLSTNTIYEVIDGQQRLTSLFLLLNALISKLPENEVKDDLIREFIGTSSLKLVPLGEDNDFFKKLVRNPASITSDDNLSGSQKRLYEAKQQFDAFVSSLSDSDLEEYIIFVSNKIEVLIFNVEDQSQAIKMFSIINDRGLPLSILDKTKSILMLFSTLKLSGELNNLINERFELIFNSYDRILENKAELNILGRFEENTLFTHHYYSAKRYFPDIWNNRDGADRIFSNIKIKCDQLKNSIQDLTDFIASYTEDLANFCKNYSKLLEELKTNNNFRKPFLYLEFTATLYPVIVRLYSIGKLEKFISVLEKVEVRVYKLKGTNPIADAYNMSSDIAEGNLSDDEIFKYFSFINSKFMNDFNFKNYLEADVYQNGSVKYILLEFNNKEIDLITYRDLQTEHIFSQEPNFEVIDYGFSDDYSYEIDRIGNLLLLESKKNKSLQNVPPIHKVNVYTQSKIKETRECGGEINHGDFNKVSIDNRRNKIIDFCLERFMID